MPEVILWSHIWVFLHGEIFYLKELAVDCADDGVYAFFFCAPQLTITLGTGSPINLPGQSSNGDMISVYRSSGLGSCIRPSRKA